MTDDRALTSVELRYEHDLVLARQRARDCAELLGFTKQDVVRFATASSEMCRNALTYAGGGTLELILRGDPPSALLGRISDSGPGIGNLEQIFAGEYQSKTGMGLGLTGSRKLMDQLEVETGPTGTTVLLIKKVPRPPAPAARATGRRGSARSCQGERRRISCTPCASRTVSCCSCSRPSKPTRRSSKTRTVSSNR